ncbi:PPOX class F420-dependent oxidoreductase [Bailinhaonella thermotolerans]|uniref:PPOX class F420-dependent oxidoreductase n=1 Tax=Bailinhaonella thermotolerans TaxID=1070861 RepID=A0A3A4A9N5_9ACTN|nr:PPOX class F420-dependent oxidoreductase [Bailinhaonella thermotolerans]RJL23034.1 PPOX class F420-dependent oxidoreductase [Bailinhaonella thermotolerans]
MSVFSEAELAYLRGGGPHRLGRLATVGPDGTPHVVPLGWSLDPGASLIEIGGRGLARSKKFRDVAATGRAALVIDDVLPPWRPRGIEIRGRAEAVPGPVPLIRLIPERVISWGLHEGATIEDTYRARDVEAGEHA